MAEHLILGDKGENLAVKFLVSIGYEILNQNWRNKHKEIDIIASYKGFLIIIEVKTRSTSLFDKPSNSVGKKKQDFLIEATQTYIEKFDINNEVRFDIISIILNKDKYTIEHIIDAFSPEF